MKLEQLRRYAEGMLHGKVEMDRDGVRELVEDIDAQMKAIPRADGWSYKDAVHTGWIKGWNGAINAVRQISRDHVVGGRPKFEHKLNELKPHGTPVTEMRVTAPADSPLGVELSKIRDRLNAMETLTEALQGKVIVLQDEHDRLKRDGEAAELARAHHEGLTGAPARVC